MFSLLVISLQLASGQFSPRVLRGFWRDRFGQVLVGLLVATFVFGVLALARLDPDAQRAPALTVMFALLLALASVVFIVVYLDRISRQQYVGNIVARVAGETLRLVGELPYGPHVGMRVGEAVPAPGVATMGEPLTVRSPGDGWVQQISRRAVIAGAPPPRCSPRTAPGSKPPPHNFAPRLNGSIHVRSGGGACGPQAGREIPRDPHS